MSNPISWNQALEAGHTPRDYSFHASDIPEGYYQATLDFKIWADKVTGISCYFTKADSNEKILLTVYRDRTTREYVLGNTDFRDAPIEAIYNIEVKHNSKGNAKLVAATPAK